MEDIESLTETMLEFVRASVLEREPQIPRETIIDWDRLMDISSKQGLLAWVWDGICKLPIEQQPPRLQRINWGLSAQEIYNGYDKQEKVLKEMIDICNLNGLKLLVFKGFSLCNLYPKPEFRPSGDIDIYLFGEYDKGNELFSGGEMKKNEKRSEFEYKGVKVENHRYFFPQFFKKYVAIDRYLKSAAHNSSVKSKEGYFVFSNSGNLVINVVHAITHIANTKDPLTIRSLLDIGMLLYRNPSELSPERCREVMDELKMTHSFDLIVRICEWITGIDFSKYYIDNIPLSDIRSFKSQLENVCLHNGKGAEGSIKQYRERFQRMKWSIPYRVQTKREWFCRQFFKQLKILMGVLVKRKH